MNEFTKDELQQIEYALSREAMDDMPVYKKVQDLIDNYCKHENDNKFNALPEAGSVKMCKICKRFYV